MMDIESYFGLAYAALLFIFAFCGVLRCFDLWELLCGKDADEIYPARRIVACIYFSVVLLLPCALHPQSTDARLLARCFWILFVPAATALGYKRFFYGDKLHKRLRIALVGGVPIAFVLVLSCIALAGGDVLMPHRRAVIHAAGVLGALLTAYEVHVMLWLWHIMSGADAAARAADRLFPSNFASRMFFVSLLVLVVTWGEFLFGNVSSNTALAGIILISGLGILLVILHPQRVEKREDKEDMEADEDAFCMEEDADVEALQASSQSKEKKYILSEAQLDCIEGQIRKIIESRKLYLNPHLKRDMLKEKLDINRSYLSEVFARRLGPLNQYVNLLRMEYAARYAAEHPDAKLTEVARCSGFGSMATFYRVRANYEAGNLSQIDKFEDNQMMDSDLGI